MKNVSKIGPSTAMLGVVWFVLVGVSVLGRLWQPAHNVTPLAGAAIAAGAVFSTPLLAVSVPVASLAISNLALPGYGWNASGFIMAAVIYAASAWPVLLGGLARRPGLGLSGRLATAFGGALASSLVFFLTTNFAHWCLSNDYPHTAAGLIACYAAGLPFFRWMPVGDLAWSLGLMAGVVALGGMATASQPISSQPVKAA